ncbi:hypothetical protein D5R81_12345 [Parashewanella spongiae]|uniref:YHS domain-containing protein n=1 Tax=Parashewanella spongiae TaxID=342950 RepID=A0A3A6TGS6_9GAMM|nr:YHS domain-containing (seleno)protein [Parashewanella spongiae]MCL1078746.1 hypothetical protein [Parashewanella spongiae]RJY12509.1 hypothetical protein D5R81_12345 [Parashewanella spongiae]
MSSLNLSKLSIAAVIIATSLSFTAPAFSADENNVAPGLTTVGAPLGLHGIDPVAFLDINNRIAGNASYVETYQNVAYYFSSEKNKIAFKNNPSKYVPQNGGFCTFGVSVGKKFDGNPNFASVENGKLYLFLNEDIYNEFKKDKKGTIKKASKNWKKIKHTAASAL